MAIQYNQDLRSYVDTETGLRIEEATPVAVAPAKPKAPKAAPIPKEQGPFNVIGASKARLKFLAGEIKRLRKLEQEHTELTRLLDAAKGPKLAVVRDITKQRSAK